MTILRFRLCEPSAKSVRLTHREPEPRWLWRHSGGGRSDVDCEVVILNIRASCKYTYWYTLQGPCSRFLQDANCPRRGSYDVCWILEICFPPLRLHTKYAQPPFFDPILGLGNHLNRPFQLIRMRLIPGRATSWKYFTATAYYVTTERVR